MVDLSQLATVDSWVYSEALPTQGTVEFTVSWIEQDSRLAGTGTLTIRLLRATGLAAADSNGLSDPYVRLSLGSIKHKSKVAHPQPSPSPSVLTETLGPRPSPSFSALALILSPRPHSQPNPQPQPGPHPRPHP